MTLVNPATGVTQSTVTTSAGLFTFISLNPGTYQATASQTGFTTSQLRSGGGFYFGPSTSETGSPGDLGYSATTIWNDSCIDASGNSVYFSPGCTAPAEDDFTAPYSLSNPFPAGLDPVFSTASPATAVDMKTNVVDVTFYYVASTDPAYLVNLRRLGHDHAVAFASTACGSSLVQADPAARAEVLSDIKKWVDATDLLGASHLRIFAGELPDGAKLSDAVDWTVEGMKAACDYSGRKGITLGLEDHSGVTQTADVCLEIMQRVNSPYAGINLDITNFTDTPTQDAYAQIEACVPWATHVHIRDRFYGDQHLPVDMDRVWQIFAKGGMQCYISAEYEQNYPGALPPAEAVPKLVNDIKTLCKQYSSA